MKKCRFCKSRFTDSYRFCPECGAPAPEFPTFGGKMANLFKGILFVLLFIAIQYAVSLAYSIYASFAVITPENMNAGEETLINAAYEMYQRNVSTISIFIYALTIIALVIIFAVRKRKFSDGTGIKKFSAAAIPFALLAGLSLNYVVTSAMVFIPIPESFQEMYDEIYSFMGEGNFIIEFIATAILAPIVEEIVFRGLCYRYARRAFPTFVAALISGVIFGLSHGNPISFVFTTILGIILAYAYEKSGSIVPSILIHIGFNGGAYIVERSPIVWNFESISVLFLATLAASIISCTVLFKISKKEIPVEATPFFVQKVNPVCPPDEITDSETETNA